MGTILNALEIPSPEAQGKLTLTASDLKFSRGQLITKWLSVHDAKVTLTGAELDPVMTSRILFRWRLKPAPPESKQQGSSQTIRYE